MSNTFDIVNAVAGNTERGGVALALDNGRAVILCHFEPARARQVADMLHDAADRADPIHGGLTGEEAQAP